uniref:DM5 domain-containing protein n=1 Tax=Rhabditophanes sp. KR3021 TaxID=114890 RepID=A0AC35UI26_9BILA
MVLADKSAYIPADINLTGAGKNDSSNFDLDDVDFFSRPATAPVAVPPKSVVTPVVVPPPPKSPQVKLPIVYKKATTYQKTYAGQK